MVQSRLRGDTFEAGRLLVFQPQRSHCDFFSKRRALHDAGGEPMDGPRYIWWNFVSSSKERIEAAKDDWARARFQIVPGDEKEFIPLPD